MRSIFDAQVTLSQMGDVSLEIKPGDMIFLYGELGTGKTTLVRSLISQLSGREMLVTSPTYTYYQVYPGNMFHFDLYRCQTYEDIIRIGAEEILDRDDGVCFVEWPEILKPVFSPSHEVRLSHIDDANMRSVKIYRCDNM